MKQIPQHMQSTGRDQQTRLPAPSIVRDSTDILNKNHILINVSTKKITGQK